MSRMEDPKSVASSKSKKDENEKVKDVRPNLLHEPWCCGSLETGAVSIGVTNLVTLLILFLWVIQIILELHQYFIAIIVTSCVAFVLFVVNVCLIFGARARKRSLVLPWMLLYLFVLLGLIVACSIQFHEMGQLRPISVVACVILSYFYFVVAAFYHELAFEDRTKAARMEAEEEMVEVKKKKKVTDCLISLEEEEEDKDGGGGDETFTDLAHSRKENPFLTPSQIKKGSSFLPQPDEVIQIPTTSTTMDQEDFFQSRPEPPQKEGVGKGDVTDGTAAAAEEDLFSGIIKQFSLEREEDLFFLDSKQESQPEASGSSAAAAASGLPNHNHPKAGISKSIDTSLLLRGPSTISPSKSTGGREEDESRVESNQELTGAEGGAAVAAGGDVTLPKSRGISLSHSGLIGTIDSSFSPFKEKNPAKSGLPKMTIFLPKSDAEDSSSHSSSSSSCDEEEVMINKE